MLAGPRRLQNRIYFKLRTREVNKSTTGDRSAFDKDTRTPTSGENDQGGAGEETQEEGGATERGNKVQTRQQTMTIEPTSQVAVEKDFVVDISGDIYCPQGNRPSVFLEG